MTLSPTDARTKHLQGKYLDFGGMFYNGMHKDIALVGDDSTDNAAKLQDLGDYISGKGGGFIGIAEPGTYQIQDDVIWDETVVLLTAPGVLLKVTNGTFKHSGAIMNSHWYCLLASGAGIIDLADYTGDFISVHWFGEGRTDLGVCINGALAAIDYTNPTNRRQHLRMASSGPQKWPVLTSISMDGANGIDLGGMGWWETELEIGAGLAITGISAVGCGECSLHDFRIIEASGSLVSDCIRITGQSWTCYNIWTGNANNGFCTENATGTQYATGTFTNIWSESCASANMILNGLDAVYVGLQSDNDYGSSIIIKSSRCQYFGVRVKNASSFLDGTQGIGVEIAAGSHNEVHVVGFQCGLEAVNVTGGAGNNEIHVEAYDCGKTTKSPAVALSTERNSVFARMRDTGNTMQGVDVLAGSLNDIYVLAARALEDFEVRTDSGSATHTRVNGTVVESLSGAAPTAANYPGWGGTDVIDDDTGNVWKLHPDGTSSPLQIK